MSLLRNTIIRTTPRAFVRTPALSLNARRPFGDYGSGEGDPKGEKPQEQGANPSADKEHPGPPPPKAGEGSGGATKANKDGHNTGSSAQGKKSFSTYARLNAKDELRPKDTKGAKPTILSESPPAEKDQPKEVQEHNKDMDQRAEQAHEKVEEQDGEKKDKVSKKFWAGTGGAEKEA